MGVVKQVVELMVAEQAYKPLQGEFCFFGRQTISISPAGIESIFKRNNLVHPQVRTEIDTETRHENETITDKSFINYFGQNKLNIVDVSDYEGANIIADLNDPVSEELQNKFDFIYTGGCHDNVFSPAELLKNCSRMLKPGGRAIHFESFGGLIGAYTYLTPEWFYSFYAINNYSDCKVYVCHQEKKSKSRFEYETDIYAYSPYYKRTPDYDYFKAAVSASGILYVMVIAEKGIESSNQKIPMQMQYLDGAQTDWRKRAVVFDSSCRPLMKCRNPQPDKILFDTNHYKHIGVI